MNLLPHQIIIAPIISEESQIQTGKANQYTFRVHPKANKHQIKNAVESFFADVKVIRVNTMNYAGKSRRRFGTNVMGRKSSWKKALVTLRDGDTIELI